MFIKICGISSIDTALAVADANADMIGFVFAPSKRQLSIPQAEEIAKKLPHTIQKVGVFVDEPLENILSIIEKLNLDIVQLHGDESIAYQKKIPIPIIKAFPATTEGLQQANQSSAKYILIDSPPVQSSRGGNGVTFNWNMLKDQPFTDKLILAGGLNTDNILEAIQTVRPAGVDVSSGVELNGKKDVQKINQFITKVQKERKDVLQ
ncbi:MULTISPECIES: phosphoribosylanthranilate isomerase [Oceanobacillus]|uniref:phosphoribosylanthranilate isomerase n=1 Tax=Oceanobacillus TaxID=182709 RepID=UPI00084E6ED2|nr:MULTISPECIES: phosphoribosylanthranilate isomerase [Oceanobacillus]MBT2652885.1 phosphoribosylanthranilate isomerase [Oceanobacillus sp. ISL-73]MCT1577429.1 phosphoribosylanthranilate isomerase [Oceanobacillus kimchii]MCT2137035.1 phosphoribosylanthranilate isomerase [Oceanobacillus kimchii]OEH53630.1 N-(5'-phosphoribosyl)anthranilate isomerase [Oceanobacillus sp. E9]